MEALRARGAEAAPHHPAVAEYLFRGRVFEEIEVRRLEAHYGRENIVRQPAFDWGFGEEGHSDAFILPERELVEVKSTTTPTLSSPMVDMSIEQLRLAIRFYEHPEVGKAKRGLLLMLDPNRQAPADVIPVMLTDEDVARQDEAIAALRASIAGGDLPERVCARPSQARGRLCAFAEPCFEGWEEPAPGHAHDPELVDLVSRLVGIRNRKRPLKVEIDEIEEEERELKLRISEDLAEGETIVGPFEVKLTQVKRAPKFQEKLAKAAGFPMATLEEFYTPGAEYPLVTISSADEPTEIDYGDEAPF
jgi:hypothetical protein